MSTETPKKRIWTINLTNLRKIIFKKFILIFGSVITLIAIVYAAIGSFDNSKKLLKNAVYGEEIGNKGLRYKHGDYIYNPKTGDILVDSISWLHVPYGDSIGILAKKGKRAYINLNSGEVITPLEYDKAWQFSSERGVMVKNDSIYIFKTDGELVNPEGFKYNGQYELLYYRGKLSLKIGDKKVGLLDTAAQWILQPVYTYIVNEHQHDLYNTKIDEKCIVYNYDLDTILEGDYKQVDIDWSEGIIATEHNGIQHLFDYKGKLVYEVIFQDIRELSYNTMRVDSDGKEIWESTECYAYIDYNNKEGLMDKNYKVLTPPLFHDIKARGKHIFFATFGEYHDKFGTLIDNHGKPIR